MSFTIRLYESLQPRWTLQTPIHCKCISSGSMKIMKISYVQDHSCPVVILQFTCIIAIIHYDLKHSNKTCILIVVHFWHRLRHNHSLFCFKFNFLTLQFVQYTIKVILCASEHICWIVRYCFRSFKKIHVLTDANVLVLIDTDQSIFVNGRFSFPSDIHRPIIYA